MKCFLEHLGVGQRQNKFDLLPGMSDVINMRHPTFFRRASPCRAAKLLVVVLFAASSGRIAPLHATEGKAYKMEKFVVNEKHLLCFGIAITLWRDANTGLVQAMYVKDVAPDSMAEKKGIRPGTRIWAIDNIPADNFEATFAADSELGKKFLNRQKDDKILLEVTLLGEHSTRTVVLQQNVMTVDVNVTTVNSAPKADWNWSPPKKAGGEPPSAAPPK